MFLELSVVWDDREAYSVLEHPKIAPRLDDLRNRVTNQAVEQVA
jgi:hypothetical protein